VIREQRRVLRVRDLRRVQPGIDPDDRLALARERRASRIGQAARAGEPLADAAPALELRQVLRARDEEHDHRPALRRATDLLQLHAVARRGEPR
jgi:hypothetical protein